VLGELRQLRAAEHQQHDDEDDDQLARSEVHAGKPNPSGADDAARRLRALAPDTAPFALGQPTPDPELLAVLQRELETLLLDDAPSAHLFGLTGGGAALGEEEIWIDAETVGAVLPVLLQFRGLEH